MSTLQVTVSSAHLYGILCVSSDRFFNEPEREYYYEGIHVTSFDDHHVSFRTQNGHIAMLSAIVSENGVDVRVERPHFKRLKEILSHVEDTEVSLEFGMGGIRILNLKF